MTPVRVHSAGSVAPATATAEESVCVTRALTTEPVWLEIVCVKVTALPPVMAWALLTWTTATSAIVHASGLGNDW